MKGSWARFIIVFEEFSKGLEKKIKNWMQWNKYLEQGLGCGGSLMLSKLWGLRTRRCTKPTRTITNPQTLNPKP